MRSVKPKKVWTKLRNGLFGWRVERVGRQRLKESVNQSGAGLESSSAVKNIFTKKLNIFETDTGKVPVDTNISSGGVIGGTVRKRKRRESDPDQD